MNITAFPILLPGGWLRRGIVWFCLATFALAAKPAQTQEDDIAQLPHTGGQVLLLRHALAPGTGDPDRFRIGDCSSQRNLSEAGLVQARATGGWLRDRGVKRARVYSSQWCRCLETARLLDLGPVEELPGLNSFYERPQDREPNLAAVRAFLASQPLNGELLVMVTHQVTISALTGEFADSGHGVLMSLGDAGTRKVGRLSFGR